MKILVIEDNTYRIVFFKQKFIGEDLHLAKNYDEAINELNNNSPFDLVCFDHDLEEAHYQADYSNNKTGYDVALHLETMKDKLPTNAIIHTLNPDGAINIARCLKSLGIVYNRIPYGTGMLKN